jgi:hypothetical protein
MVRGYRSPLLDRTASMATVVVIAAIVVTLATVAYFVFAQHPQEASGPAGDRKRPASAEFFGDRNDRPGGPGSEADGVAERGQIVPGPSFEAGGNEPLNGPSA